MSTPDQRFQHRWEFRRTENDFDSSDDDHSRPASASEPKLIKHKLVTCLFPEENAQTTMRSPTSSLPRGEKENHSSFDEPNQAGKMHGREARSRKTKRKTSDHEPSNAALIDLRGYMESLVEGIKITREDLLAWMNKEMKLSSKDDAVSSKPSGTRKGQRQSAKRIKTPRNNPITSRKKTAIVTQNCEDGSSGKKSPQTNDADEKKKIEKPKGKVARSSTKKQKIAGVVEAGEQTDKGGNHMTLPTVLPEKQVANSEIPLENGNEKDVGKRNALNSGVDLSSHQLNFDPRSLHNDGIFAQSGLRNLSEYEQNACPSMGSGIENGNGNGNGNAFPFPLAPQVSNAGIGMRNIPSQYGLQYLTQGNRMPGMYREPFRFSNGNHAFMESYGSLNQHLKFNVQQGGVMALQCPEIRRGAFNQSNITTQQVFHKQAE